MNEAQAKYERLLARIGEYSSAIVAFSGGLDSGFLLHAARAVFAPRSEPGLLAVLVRSPAVPEWDCEDAVRIAQEVGVPLRVVETNLLDQPRYKENNPLRCYFCKADLYTRLTTIRQAEGHAVIFSGTQADDLGDYRPGLRAAAEHAVASPLLDAGLTKAEIRRLAREFGLSFWDKPGSPCLASRIPRGAPVTLEALTVVQRAESALRHLGLRVVRVRHLGDAARVEIGEDDFGSATTGALRQAVEDALRAAGFKGVSIARYAPSGRALLTPGA